MSDLWLLEYTNYRSQFCNFSGNRPPSVRMASVKSCRNVNTISGRSRVWTSQLEALSEIDDFF